MVEAPQAGNQISGSAFRSAALAKGDLGAAIGQDVGGIFQGVADSIQKARNTKVIFQADQALTKTKQDFVASLSTDPELASDPGKWLPAFQEKSQQATDAIMNQDNLSPEAKRHLNMMTKNWTTEATGDIQTAALKRETKDTRDAGLRTANEALADGKVDKAVVSYKALNEAGVIGPKMRDALIAQAPGKAAEGMANQAIARFPIDSPKVLPTLTGWDKIKPANQRILIHQANEARAGAQAANLNSFSQQLDDSPDHTLPDGLKKAMDSDQITAKGYEGIVTRSKRLVAEDQKQASLEDRNEGLLVGLDLANANFVGSKDPKAQAADFTDRINGVTDVALRTRLTDQLNRKVDAAQSKGEQSEKPVFKEQMDYMKQDFEEGSAFVPMTNGQPATRKWFGLAEDQPAQAPMIVAGGVKGIQKLTEDQMDDYFGKGAKKSDIIEAARLNYAKKQKAFMDWAHDPKNADATPEEAAAERRRLEAPDVEAQVAAALAHP